MRNMLVLVIGLLGCAEDEARSRRLADVQHVCARLPAFVSCDSEGETARCEADAEVGCVFVAVPRGHEDAHTVTCVSSCSVH